MKVTNVLLAMSAIAMATSCSNDEVMDVNPSETIQFSVTAGKPSRAAATTTNSIKAFKVTAYTQNKKYMDNVAVSKSDGKWSYSPTKFWPETGVDFFAVSPVYFSNGGYGTITNDGKGVDWYGVGNGHEDLLYATKIKQSKKDGDVKINFRHALSQIRFQAKNTNNDLTVKLEGIQVDSVLWRGDLKLATKSTDPNLNEDKSDQTENDETWGVWTLWDKERAWPSQKSYTYINYPDPITLDQNVAKSDTAALFLMPQKLSSWLSSDGTVNDRDGARVLVNCQVTDKNTGIQLWPKTIGAYGKVAISLPNPSQDGKWKQGKVYIYTLVFGEGAGYDPKDPDNPDPVLVPIRLDVTVDELQSGNALSEDI